MSLTVDVQERLIKMVTFSLEGSIDTSTYLKLERKVDQALEEDAMIIVFDMKEVEYMSSVGVRIILKVRKSLKKRDGRVFLVHLQPQIKKVLEFVNALPSMEAFPIEQLDMYLDEIQRKFLGDDYGVMKKDEPS